MQTDNFQSQDIVKNHSVDHALKALQKEYILIGKTRVTAWHAWLLISLAAGIVAGIVLVASREGEIEKGRAATDLTSGLVGYWKFDETSGTSAADSSGKNLTATLCNGTTCLQQGPLWTQGKMGNALQFDGANDYVAFPKVGFTTSGGHALAAWVKPTQWRRDQVIVGIPVYASNSQYLYLGITAADTIIFAYRDDGGQERAWTTSTSLRVTPTTPDGWYHIVAVRAKGGEVALYVNGKKELSDQDSSPYEISTTNSNPGSKFTIGAFVVPVQSSSYFGGLIDEVRIYSRALNAGEVASISPTPPQLKLIQFGSDVKGAQFIKDNIAQMESKPLNGATVRLFPNGETELGFSFSRWAFTNKKWIRDQLSTDIGNLKNTPPFTSFTDMFAYMITGFNPNECIETPSVCKPSYYGYETPDVFDDWTVLLDNTKLMAEIAKEGKLKGIFLDTEFSYGSTGSNILDSRWMKYPKSLEEYRNQARLRGQQFMDALETGYPDITILMTVCYGYVTLQSSFVDEFCDGMMGAADGRTVIHEMNELSYGGRNEYWDFIAPKQQLQNNAMTTTKFIDKLAGHYRVGFGIWVDYSSWGCKPELPQYCWQSNVAKGDLTANYFAPDGPNKYPQSSEAYSPGWKQAVIWALKNTEGYAWVYNENNVDWWTGTDLPQGYVDATARALSESRSSSGLIGRWKLDEGAGTNVRDASLFANDGSLCNGDMTCSTSGPLWVAGVNGNGGALQFDGVDDSVKITTNPSFVTQGGHAIAARVKPAASDGSLLRPILIYPIYTSNAQYLMLALNDRNQVIFSFRDDGGNEVALVGSTVLNAGTWYHIAGVRYTSKVLKIFINGQEAASLLESSNAKEITTTNPQFPLRIGGRSGNGYFKGTLDEVHLYNYPLIPSEIKQLASIISSPPPSTGSIRIKRVDQNLDLFPSTAWIDVVNPPPTISPNPADFTGTTVGTHTAYVTDASGYTETAGTCPYAEPVAGNPNECSVTSFFTPTCNGTSCSISVNVGQGMVTKVAFKYTPIPVTTYSLSVSKSGSGSGTISSSPAGISCGTTCSTSFTQGTSVTLTVTPVSGSTFSGWSGACTGTSTTCTLAMDSAKSVMATFVTAPPPISCIQTSTEKSAKFISQIGVPTSMARGQTATVSITMCNNGSATWDQTGTFAYRLGSENPKGNTKWGLKRVNLPISKVYPGQTTTFTFPITAPTTVNTYNFQWRMLREYYGSFGDFTTNVPISVY